MTASYLYPVKSSNGQSWSGLQVCVPDNSPFLTLSRYYLLFFYIYVFTLTSQFENQAIHIFIYNILFHGHVWWLNDKKIIVMFLSIYIYNLLELRLTWEISSSPPQCPYQQWTPACSTPSTRVCSSPRSPSAPTLPAPSYCISLTPTNCILDILTELVAIQKLRIQFEVETFIPWLHHITSQWDQIILLSRIYFGDLVN